MKKLFALMLTLVASACWGQIRVNCGGPAFTDLSGKTWAADSGFTGGFTYSTGTAISGATAPALYQSERYAMSAYTFTGLASGTWTVTLKFAEIFFTASGRRVFNVAINGSTVLPSFDIFAQAGGSFRALDKTFSITPSNGQISISFTALVDNAKISAIELLPPSGPAPSVSVSVLPAGAILTAGLTMQFAASVTGTTNTAVTWAVSPAGSGTISSAGLYTAPATISTQQTVSVIATSVADPTKSGNAVVTLNPPAPPPPPSGCPAITVVLPLAYNTATCTITCPGCLGYLTAIPANVVIKDSSGNVSIPGSLATGAGGTSPANVQLGGLPNGTLCLSNGIVKTVPSGTPCP